MAVTVFGCKSVHIHLLLGIAHWHFGIRNEIRDNQDPEKERVNMGIALVTPARKVVELVETFERERPEAPYIIPAD